MQIFATFGKVSLQVRKKRKFLKHMVKVLTRSFMVSNCVFLGEDIFVDGQVVKDQKPV